MPPDAGPRYFIMIAGLVILTIECYVDSCLVSTASFLRSNGTLTCVLAVSTLEIRACPSERTISRNLSRFQACAAYTRPALQPLSLGAKGPFSLAVICPQTPSPLIPPFRLKG